MKNILLTILYTIMIGLILIIPVIVLLSPLLIIYLSPDDCYCKLHFFIPSILVFSTLIIFSYPKNGKVWVFFVEKWNDSRHKNKLDNEVNKWIKENSKI